MRLFTLSSVLSILALPQSKTRRLVGNNPLDPLAEYYRHELFLGGVIGALFFFFFQRLDFAR